MKKSSFVEGTMIATIAIVITKILGMFYVIPFYAMVGVKGSALYAYAYSIYSICLDISSAGLPIAMSKIINEYNTLGKMEAKVRAYKIGKALMVSMGIVVFILMFAFAPQIASTLLGNLEGGNTIRDVSLAIRSVSFAILVIPFLSVTKGYLQGHNVLRLPSLSTVIEQVVRIAIILGGTYFVLHIANGSVTTAICVSVLGAFFGGLAAYLLLKIGIMRDKSGLVDLNKEYKKDDVTNKEITKKILSYAIPFIIVNVVGSCYNFVDMTLILRTMNHLNLSANDVEFVTSSITTYAPKINMIITSLAMGMSASLIPNIVEAYTLNKWDDVNKKFNQAMQIIFFISIPMAIGISLLANSIWGMFYGHNTMGTYILALQIFSGLCINVYMTTSATVQGLNKFKTVYLSTITGFVSNALLDVPLMLLFSKLGLPPYLGAVTASIVGYSISIMIALVSLKKDCKLKYRETFNVLMKMLLPLIVMVASVLLLKYFVPYNMNSRVSCFLFAALCGIVGGTLYILIAFKMGIVDKVFGKATINRILKIISFGKIKEK
jgi:O-antigen/teichoic acid export membrane protein